VCAPCDQHSIIIDRNKGRQVADLISYLIDKYVKMEHSKRAREFEKKLEALKKPKAQRKLMDFV